MSMSPLGSHSQKFQIDTADLHNNTHHSSHIMNAFIPLDHVTGADFGSAEMMPNLTLNTQLLDNPEGTHVAKTSMQEMERLVAPLMNVGDFDF